MSLEVGKFTRQHMIVYGLIALLAGAGTYYLTTFSLVNCNNIQQTDPREVCKQSDSIGRFVLNFGYIIPIIFIILMIADNYTKRKDGKQTQENQK